MDNRIAEELRSRHRKHIAACIDLLHTGYVEIAVNDFITLRRSGKGFEVIDEITGARVRCADEAEAVAVLLEVLS